MDKFTPGPWWNDWSKGGITGPRAAVGVYLHGKAMWTPIIGGVRGGNAWGLVAIVPHGEGDVEADARLIAASPDLLEVAKLALKACNKDRIMNREDNCGLDFVPDLAKKARAALKKARGS